MKKTVVHILSSGHSGSHYLSLLLGSHSNMLHVGELFQLKRKKGAMLKDVYFTPSPVFDGIGPHNIRDVYDIIFSRIGTHVEAVVDTSKVLRGWTKMFVRDDRHQHKYLHLIRDPRALVRRGLAGHNPWRIRWKLLRSWPWVPARAAFGDLQSILMYRWLQQNRAFTRFIRRHHLAANLVTYRDLAKQTGAEVRRLTEWAGLTYEPSQLEYWNREHIGTQRRGYDWVKEQKTAYFDLRWKTELPLPLQEQICRDQTVNKYVRELGLAFTDEGLTRVSEVPPYSA